jgi:hypothetical protein
MDMPFNCLDGLCEKRFTFVFHEATVTSGLRLKDESSANVRAGYSEIAMAKTKIPDLTLAEISVVLLWASSAGQGKLDPRVLSDSGNLFFYDLLFFLIVFSETLGVSG